MLFPHLDWNRRLLIYGALAGVVMELAVLGAFFWPKGTEPFEGLTMTQTRTLELLPFVALGGVAFLAGAGCFVAAMALTVMKGRRRRKKRRRGRPTQVSR